MITEQHYFDARIDFDALYKNPKPCPVTNDQLNWATALYVTDEPVNEQTGDTLKATLIINSWVKWKYAGHPLSRPYLDACNEFLLAKKRFEWLSRFVVKTPPVTPQLNLF
jgi:hypothetical protein